MEEEEEEEEVEVEEEEEEEEKEEDSFIEPCCCRTGVTWDNADACEMTCAVSFSKRVWDKWGHGIVQLFLFLFR